MSINASIIIEIMGRPADYLKENMLKLVDKMGSEKGVKILGRKISETKKIENSDFFTIFAEIELEFESLKQLILIIFTYMPSHIEITKPEEIRMSNYDLNVLCNEITLRLHNYDEIAKSIIFEKKILENQLKQYGIEPATQPARIPEKAKKEKKARKRKKKN